MTTWIAAQQDREIRMLLEDRLIDFIDWLQEAHGITLADFDAGFEVNRSRTIDLIKEYVNS